MMYLHTGMIRATDHRYSVMYGCSGGRMTEISMRMRKLYKKCEGLVPVAASQGFPPSNKYAAAIEIPNL